MGGGDFALGVGVVPFIHAPEVGVFEIDLKFVDQARDEGELFGGAYWAAYAYGIVGGGLSPGVNVFESFCEVEVFVGVVHDYFEAWAGELAEIFFGQARAALMSAGSRVV